MTTPDPSDEGAPVVRHLLSRVLDYLEDFCARRDWAAACFRIMWLKRKLGLAVWRRGWK